MAAIWIKFPLENLETKFIKMTEVVWAGDAIDGFVRN